MRHPLEPINELARLARAEGARMHAAVAERTGGEVRMPVAQFRALADLLAALGRSAGACGGADCMGAPVDGIRTWVARDQPPAPLPATMRRAGDLTL